MLGLIKNGFNDAQWHTENINLTILFFNYFIQNYVPYV